MTWHLYGTNDVFSFVTSSWDDLKLLWIVRHWFIWWLITYLVPGYYIWKCCCFINKSINQYLSATLWHTGALIVGIDSLVYAYTWNTWGWIWLLLAFTLQNCLYPDLINFTLSWDCRIRMICQARNLQNGQSYKAVCSVGQVDLWKFGNPHHLLGYHVGWSSASN